MKGKLLKNIKCFFVGFLIAIFSIENTYGASYMMNVKKYAQLQDEWCWAACAQMVGNYYGRLYSQAAICKYVKGNVVNATAKLEEITQALKFTTKKNVLLTQTKDTNAFIVAAKNKRPTVLRIQHKFTNSGHAYVVYGAEEQIGPELGGVHLIDPYENHENVFRTYIELLNGAELEAGYGTYSHAWFVFK